MPHEPKQPLKNILVLTYEAADAALEGRLEELSALLTAREAMVAQVDEADYDPDLLQQISDGETMLLSAIKRSREGIMAEMVRSTKSRNSLKNYGGSSSNAGYDLTG